MMPLVRDEWSDETARRRERERIMLEEGEAIWRAKQRQQWIAKIQEQREARDLLLSYAPWGRPGCGAPNNHSDARKKKIQDVNIPSAQSVTSGALTLGRPGCGAPLRTRSGRLQTIVLRDPLLRFREPMRRCIEDEFRYRASPSQKVAYKTQLDHLVCERRKVQAEAKKNLIHEAAPSPWGRPGPGGVAWRNHRNSEMRFLHSLGWSISDPTLNTIGKVASCAAFGETSSSDRVDSHKDATKQNKTRNDAPLAGSGYELGPLLTRRRGLCNLLGHQASRHPLCSTDITRFPVPGIPEPKYYEDKDYQQTLRRQIISKQKQIEETRAIELESSRRHFETWHQFWGRPGHGAPKLPAPRITLEDLLSTNDGGPPP